MNVQKDHNPLEILRTILVEQKGMLRTADLQAFSIPRSYLSLLVEKGEIERIERGVYKAVNALEDELFAFQARYTASYFSHETALYLHNLTDRTPLYYAISVPLTYHSFSLTESAHKVFYVKDDLFDLGVVSLQTPHGNAIKATDLERTIVDITRSRKKLDTQIFHHAIKAYTQRQEKNINLLDEYAKKFRVHKLIRQYLEILL